MGKKSQQRKTALVTGAARRIGANVVNALHADGMNVIVHCRNSRQEARLLVSELNQRRDNSAHLAQADLIEIKSIKRLAKESLQRWGRLDVLVNNASAFFAAGLGGLNEETWNRLINVNLKAPLFLVAELAAELQCRNGCIINISDVHAKRPLKEHTLYCISKAGLDMLTKALARELATKVRCNAIAPGAIDWAKNNRDTKKQEAVIKKIALKRTGTAQDVAEAVLFLIHAQYVTGQIINVDGGRTLSQ